MTAVIDRRRIRHAHMVNIDRQCMVEGMRADFLAIDALSSRLIEKARKAKTIRVTSKAGTDLVAEFAPHLKWLKTSGIISPDKWGNLPGGEIFTSPWDVNGRFVVDGVVGDYLCRKYGDLRQTPLTIEVRGSRIAGLECINHELVEEFRRYTETDENSDRVGEFAIGTNIAVEDVRGNILQDEKIPGVHIAFGHPYAEHTGQDWVSTTHIDCVAPRDVTVWMDGEEVMRDGEFLI
jgi:leucyl aminopeptidase (aminopeptidase T)